MVAGPAAAGVYALLPRAATNRVYGATSLALTQAELVLIDRLALGGVVARTGVTGFGGVNYVTFECDERPLADGELRVLSNLSSLQALFAVEGDLLRPLTVEPRRQYDDDITTIQRYTGKTNELFTRLLVNVTLAAAGNGGGFTRLLAGETVRLLDPLCGRGTTLNQAVVYGLDAYGIEIDRRDFEAYGQFIVTWLEDKGIKHRAERAKLRRGRAVPAQRLSVSYGPVAGSSRRRLIEIVNDDTVNATEHVKARSIDLVVGDLPYGVQHENRPGAGRVSRNPDDLLQRALPVWRQLLRGDGAIGLAWNVRTLPRRRMYELLVDAGFSPCQTEDDESFLHRVDRVITRDVVVATRSGPSGGTTR